jgi:hypothetical protein
MQEIVGKSPLPDWVSWEIINKTVEHFTEPP